MKLGVCGGAAQEEMIRAYGFDYVEETLNRIASMEDAAFAALAARYEAVGRPPMICPRCVSGRRCSRTSATMED